MSLPKIPPETQQKIKVARSQIKQIRKQKDKLQTKADGRRQDLVSKIDELSRALSAHDTDITSQLNDLDGQIAAVKAQIFMEPYMSANYTPKAINDMLI